VRADNIWNTERWVPRAVQTGPFYDTVADEGIRIYIYILERRYITTRPRTTFLRGGCGFSAADTGRRGGGDEGARIGTTGATG